MIRQLFTTFALLFLFAGYAQSQQLQIPVGQQGEAQQSLPQRGDSKATVEKEHGEPLQRSTTGQPPITRWNYPLFSVYFEGGWVIHSVKTFSPKHPVK